eukprot:CAMPEP_0173305300 /NCGR_PEP_ID=MMETSP1143-20121109/19926_1 /TAXON_ID=483371 /ORGANISM="non described non described, Strain CCMP2298" /LENGTH=98 /DNA_ID=CAMNT_0014246221 /DNA_START=1001 /DNA_END=1297 /DNA_ORIENTATION=-
MSTTRSPGYRAERKPFRMPGVAEASFNMGADRMTFPVTYLAKLGPRMSTGAGTWARMLSARRVEVEVVVRKGCTLAKHTSSSASSTGLGLIIAALWGQ